MKKIAFLIFITTVTGLMLSAGPNRPVFERMGASWSRESIFFGVNEAWRLKSEPKVQLTYLARDQYRPFPLKEFPFNDYPKYLTKLRETGLIPAGITDWKIESYAHQKMENGAILVKVSGSYQRKTEVVKFSEWQIFEEDRYSQGTLIIPAGVKTKNIRESRVLEQVLKL